MLPEDVEGATTVLYKTWLETYPNERLGITKEDIEESYKGHFEEESIKRLQEKIKKLPSNEKRIVAVLDNRIAGVGSLVKHEGYNEFKTIYVLPEYQGKGIGKRLWNELKNFLDPTKDTTVEVADYTTDTIEFYKKLGFVDTGKRFTDDRFTFKSGAFIPEMEMKISAGR